MMSYAELKSEPKKPVGAIVLGVVGLFAWILPIVGLPLNLVGLSLGIKALGRGKSGMAVAAIVLCSIGLALTLANAILGAYLGATGQHALVNELKEAAQNKGQ
jgi:4-amino-4-deoxy-L-arabinose transferase-like glycosyltransferase